MFYGSSRLAAAWLAAAFALPAAAEEADMLDVHAADYAAAGGAPRPSFALWAEAKED